MAKAYVGHFKGPKGDPGEQGPVGPKGETGAQGPNPSVDYKCFYIMVDDPDIIIETDASISISGRIALIKWGNIIVATGTVGIDVYEELIDDTICSILLPSGYIPFNETIITPLNPDLLDTDRKGEAGGYIVFEDNSKSNPKIIIKNLKAAGTYFMNCTYIVPE